MRTSTLASPARKSRFIAARDGRDLAARRLLECNYSSIVLPEDVAAASSVVLQTIVDQATEALSTLAGLSSPSGDDVTEGKRLLGLIQAGQTELNTRGAAAGQRKDELGGLLAELAPAAEAELAADPAVETPAVETPAVETPAEAVVAAGGVPTPRASEVRNAGGGSDPVVPARAPRMALTAAPDAIGVAQGHAYGDFMEAAGGILERTALYPTSVVEGGARQRFQNGALRLRRQFESGLIAAGFDADAAIEFACDLARIGGADALLASAAIPQNGMVAGGGWGSPSETLYELVELEATDGMVDVPEIQIVRGGTRYTRGPEFSTFRGKGFKQTEAQAIAGALKTFYRIPDGPDFVEERAGVTGLGVTVGILQNKAYPEFVARILRGLLVAHTHEVNFDTLAAIETGSTAVTNNLGAGAFAQLLAAIELQATDIRYKHSMDQNTVLEVVLPQWAIPIIKQDLAFREGWDVNRIPDAEIISHFTERRVRPQFVKDWQDSALGQAAAATAWPANIKFLIYPAATWVRGLGEVISVDTIYDSAGLADNEFTGLFTEESFLVTKRGHESRVVTVPVKADGSSPAIELMKTVP